MTTNGHQRIYRTSIENYCTLIDHLKEKGLAPREIDMTIHAMRTTERDYFREKYGPLTFEQLSNFMQAVKTYGITREGAHTFPNTASLLQTLLCIHQRVGRETVGKSLDEVCIEAEVHRRSIYSSIAHIQRRETRASPELSLPPEELAAITIHGAVRPLLKR